MPAEQRTPAITTAAGSVRDAATASGYSRRNKVRSLQRSLFRAAKVDRRRVFHQLYQHLWRDDVLRESYKQVRSNGGAGGIDDVDLEAFDQVSEIELRRLSKELRDGSYRPQAVRRVYIPKARGGRRPLGIPTIRDRIVQTAVRIVLEPVFEARFYEHSYGFRPRRSAHQALELTSRLLNAGYRHVLDLDIEAFFDSVEHGKLLATVRRQVSDSRMLRLLKRILKAPIHEPNGMVCRSRKGCPQGGPLSPLLANAYLSILDLWFLKHVS